MNLKGLEEKLGLPPLGTVTSMVSGKTGTRVSTILGRLERLSKDSAGILNAMELLKIVERLDDKGTLQRLDTLLRDLQPLLKSKNIGSMLSKLEQYLPMLQELLGETKGGT